MLGIDGPPRAANRDEAEKPFWISFSDLMTALMILFLVTMAVALFSVTVPMGIENIEIGKRATAIESCVTELQYIAESYQGITIKDHTIDFGTRATFSNNSSDLNPEQKTLLRLFIPDVLSIAARPVCKNWLRQVVVEGFASHSGTYLHNLDLTTKRSERVLCTLLEASARSQVTAAERRLIQNLFFVGGYSFNSGRDTPEDSRRIELKLVFYGLHDPKESPPQVALDNDATCPIDTR